MVEKIDYNEMFEFFTLIDNPKIVPWRKFEKALYSWVGEDRERTEIYDALGTIIIEMDKVVDLYKHMKEMIGEV